MKIKVFRIIQIVEEGENLIGYGFADDYNCIGRIGSKIITYTSEMQGLVSGDVIPEFAGDTAFKQMVQEQTNDLWQISVQYEEYDLGAEKLWAKPVGDEPTPEFLRGLQELRKATTNEENKQMYKRGNQFEDKDKITNGV